ncbi:MAG: methyltransferase domain-containing protein [Methanothrix sp.]
MKWFQVGDKNLEYYDDLLIMADTGLHDQVASLLIELNDKARANNEILVLDIAAGEGALSKRIQDIGFTVEAVDLIGQAFKHSKTIPFHEIDLNDSNAWNHFVTSNKEHYDIIISVETIEHLENPWSFLRGLKELVKPDGHIILTTPNIESPFSKLLFFSKNSFYQFMEKDLIYGHINQLTTFELNNICKKIGLIIESTYSGGTYPIIWLKKNISFSIAWSGINIIALAFAEKTNYSIVKIYIIKK